MLEFNNGPYATAVMMGNAGAYHKDELMIRDQFRGPELVSELKKLGGALRVDPSLLQFDLQNDCVAPALDVARALKDGEGGGSLAGVGVLMDVPYNCDDNILFETKGHLALRDRRKATSGMRSLPSLNDLRSDIRAAYEHLIRAHLLSIGLPEQEIDKQVDQDLHRIKIITSARARRVMTSILHQKDGYPSMSEDIASGSSCGVVGVGCEGVYAAGFWALAHALKAEQLFAILSSSGTKRVIPGKVMEGARIARNNFDLLIQEKIIRSMAMSGKV